MDIFEICH